MCGEASRRVRKLTSPASSVSVLQVVKIKMQCKISTRRRILERQIRKNTREIIRVEELPYYGYSRLGNPKSVFGELLASVIAGGTG